LFAVLLWMLQLVIVTSVLLPCMYSPPPEFALLP